MTKYFSLSVISDPDAVTLFLGYVSVDDTNKITGVFDYSLPVPYARNKWTNVLLPKTDALADPNADDIFTNTFSENGTNFYSSALAEYFTLYQNNFNLYNDVTSTFPEGILALFTAATRTLSTRSYTITTAPIENPEDNVPVTPTTDVSSPVVKQLPPPNLIWFTQPNYNDTRLNIDNTKEIVNYWTSDTMTSEPVSRENRKDYIIGEVVYNVVQNDNSDTDRAIQFPGIKTVAYLFNYGDMNGNLLTENGIQQTLQQSQEKFEYKRIVSGSGVFAAVTGIIARQPYIDPNGVKFQQYAAYFD